MTDDELIDHWTDLAPGPDERRRINRRVSADLEAHDTSMAAEWLRLFRISPFSTLGLVTVSAMATFVLPLVWVTSTLTALLP